MAGRRAVPDTRIYRIEFVTDSDGFALTSRGLLIRTTDGGRTWSMPTGSTLSAVCFTTPSKGWATKATEVLKTSDGGRSWRIAYRSPAEGNYFSASVHCSGSASWVLFSGGGACNQQDYCMVHTLDGRRWAPLLHESYFPGCAEVERSIDSYAGPFTTAGATYAFFLGVCPACGCGTMSLTETLDGGATWRRYSLPLTAVRGDIVGISFPDSRDAWFLAREKSKGTIFGTQNAGRTWSRVFSA